MAGFGYAVPQVGAQGELKSIAFAGLGGWAGERAQTASPPRLPPLTPCVGGAPSVSDLLSRCISGLTAPTPRALDTALALAPSLTGAGGTVDVTTSSQQPGADLGGAQPAAAPTAATAAIEQLVRELDSLLPKCDIVPGKRAVLPQTASWIRPS